MSYNKTSRTMQLSEASAAIFGLPRNTTEMTADEWRLRVHPDDLQRLDAERHKHLKNAELSLSRSFASFGQTAKSGGSKQEP